MRAHLRTLDGHDLGTATLLEGVTVPRVVDAMRRGLLIVSPIEELDGELVGAPGGAEAPPREGRPLAMAGRKKT